MYASNKDSMTEEAEDKSENQNRTIIAELTEIFYVFRIRK
tara:strand:+ start:377 stop:496 length:120 start_codon:yes stop_codon:yes gene_type:complete